MAFCILDCLSETVARIGRDGAVVKSDAQRARRAPLPKTGNWFAPRSVLRELVRPYQRLLRRWPPPLPPNERSVFGRASLTFRALPSSSLPFSSAMARSASALALISTNPNPLAWPVSRSVTMLTRSTVPYASNRDLTASSVAPKLRFPTKIFFTFFPLFVKTDIQKWLIGAGSDKGGRTGLLRRC